jgi:DNA-binding MarR family transcriptional regulator
MASRALRPPAATPPLLADVPLDRTFTYRLHQLHKLTDLTSQRAYTERTGLSLADGRCLSVVGVFGPLSVKDLARAANLDKGQASRSAQYLVEQGLVRKDDDVHDGRGVVLALTPAGRKVCQKVIDEVEARNRAFFGCLDEAELRTLSALFDRLIAHARQLGEAPG